MTFSVKKKAGFPSVWIQRTFSCRRVAHQTIKMSRDRFMPSLREQNIRRWFELDLPIIISVSKNTTLTAQDEQPFYFLPFSYKYLYKWHVTTYIEWISGNEQNVLQLANKRISLWIYLKSMSRLPLVLAKFIVVSNMKRDKNLW